GAGSEDWRGKLMIKSESLPQEMQRHTYSIMYEVEGSHWWYVGRRRIIASFAEKICREFPDRRPRILDVGCGTGANLELLGKYGDAEGVDVSQEALGFCRARGLTNVRQGEAEKLPFEDGSFDLVTGLDVVEHLDDDVAGLKEMWRVLKPDGRILLFVPAFMFLWGVQDDVSHHRRRYTLKELRRAVGAAGFVVERATYANITFFAPILLGRAIMKVTGLRPASENNINVSALNGVLGRVLGAESTLLRRMNFPFGVSALCVARKV
ncbi:MAG: class I SAM-dependent methyltransferase, partial [Acidobacteriota bacterium]|nr:class I SAM-dependent methyltransferase [Acidobacteriota bacterium]